MPQDIERNMEMLRNSNGGPVRSVAERSWHRGYASGTARI